MCVHRVQHDGFPVSPLGISVTGFCRNSKASGGGDVSCHSEGTTTTPSCQCPNVKTQVLLFLRYSIIK